MSTKRDYYEILMVERTAGGEEIKKAYRKLAMQYHPDRNPGDASAEEKFKEATEAYEVLRDDQKRAAYDRFGHAGVGGAAGGYQAGFDFDLQDALHAFMRDFGGFEDLFGGRGGRPRGRTDRGHDLQVRVEMTLEEVASGVKRKLKIRKMTACSTCSGAGHAPGSRSITCEQCKGSGQLRQVHRTFIGQFINVVPCARCGGEGKIAEKPCGTCEGEGRIRGEETVDVEIPAGVMHDNYMTLPGLGDAGRKGGRAGDLIVVVQVRPHETFERHGSDLVADLPIGPARAALGGEEEVDTLDGRAEIEVPAGVQTGKVLRLRGKGLPSLNGRGTGDLLLRVIVYVPKKLSAREKELYAELEKLEAERARDHDRGFFDRLREAFRGS